MWQLPNKMKEAKIDRTYNSDQEISRGDNSLCHGLQPNLLPRDACMEAPLPDVALYLHRILLPQILYELDRMELRKLSSYTGLIIIPIFANTSMALQLIRQ